MSTIKIRYDALDAESVKKAFDTLYVFYEGDIATVLTALGSNPIAVANADVWTSDNQVKVDLITPYELGTNLVRGKQCRYQGVVYNIVQTHTVTDVNANPEVTPALFRPAPVIAPGKVYPMWNSIGLMDSENYWQLDDIVDHNGKYWKSGVAVNTWEPGATGIGDDIWDEVDVNGIPVEEGGGGDPGGGGGTTNPCEGVVAWDQNQHWSTYQVGDRRTDGGKLWECHTPQWAQSYAPSSQWGNLAWTFIADCVV